MGSYMGSICMNHEFPINVANQLKPKTRIQSKTFKNPNILTNFDEENTAFLMGFGSDDQSQRNSEEKGISEESEYSFRELEELRKKLLPPQYKEEIEKIM